jgi:hypothetical protein
MTSPALTANEQILFPRPLIGTDEAPPRKSQRVVGSALAPHKEGLVEVALVVVVDLRGPHRIAAHRHVAVDVLVELQGELFLHRQIVEAPRLGKGLPDQRVRHVVPDDQEEADRRQRLRDLPRHPLARPRHALQEIGDMDDRNSRCRS